ALDAAGNEDDLSDNEASITVEINPAPGSGLRSGGRCFIATAAFGSYLDPHVAHLRRFRDDYLMTHPAGAAFVALYYEVSPPIAEFISRHEALRTATRWALTPVAYAAAWPLPTGLGALLLAFLWLRRRA